MCLIPICSCLSSCVRIYFRFVQGGALFMCRTTALISNCRLVENTAWVSDGRILAWATHCVSLSTLLCCRAVWGGTVRWVECYVRSRGGITVRVKSREGAMQFVVSVCLCDDPIIIVGNLCRRLGAQCCYTRKARSIYCVRRRSKQTLQQTALTEQVS